ncbi:MAG UNVERIFIED_CONTAM: hypothetical protein LVR29_17130 [Microcystis novacekii LVE1205-3]
MSVISPAATLGASGSSSARTGVCEEPACSWRSRLQRLAHARRHLGSGQLARGFGEEDERADLVAVVARDDHIHRVGASAVTTFSRSVPTD